MKTTLSSPTTSPARFAIVGNPVEHSKSPQIHSLFAQQFGHNLVYEKILATDDTFVPTVKAFFEQGGMGMNITVPFKEMAIGIPDWIDPNIAPLGAINTLYRDQQGIVGDNTDSIGLIIDIVKNHHIDFKDKNVLLLGAGGAARGCIFPILMQKPKSITIANRTLSKAELLREILLTNKNHEGIDIYACQLDLIDIPRADIIINATSSSLLGDPILIASEHLASDAFVYDMMYGESATSFLSQPNFATLKTTDGLGMLVEQAAQAYWLWWGVHPKTAPVIAALRQSN